MSEHDDDPYQRYAAVVADLYALGGGTSWSQEFESAPPEHCTPQHLCSVLLDAVPREASTDASKHSASNWRWRVEERPAPGAGELALERKVVSTARAAALDSWTFHMPIMSGVTGPRIHERRAIDLVHRVADGHYELIKLEAISNDPAHAAFEILFSGLAYCRARQVLRRPIDEAHAVLEAKRIDMVVLAPRAWYRYKMRHAAFTIPYSLNRLTIVLNATLQEIGATLAIPGLDTLTFGFKVYEDDDQLLADIERGGAGKEFARGRS